MQLETSVVVSQTASGTGASSGIGEKARSLASDDSNYVHGATVSVDGGMTFYPEFAQGE